jgi:hypothetical protein
MAKVLSGIPMSVDGYITGPDDGPGKGLGEGGERLHYWVFGGPWTYADEPKGGPCGEDAAWLAEVGGRRVHVRVGGRRGGRAPREAAGEKDVHVMGGAETIRQALAAGLIDELSIVVAPVVLGGGKRLFEGFTQSLELEHLGVRQSPFATFIDYRLKGR